MKIAVCLFGHLRTFKKCAPFLRRNLLSNYDCDLFMHTWAMLDSNTKAWHDLAKLRGEAKTDSIIHAYGDFKGLEIEEQVPLDEGFIKIKHSANGKEFSTAIYGFDAMFRSMRESNRLCEEYATKNGIKYDFIVFVRPDILLKNKFNMEAILKVFSEAEVERGFFTLAHNVMPTITGLESFGKTDLMFFGKPAVISDVVKNNAQCVGRLKQNTTLSHCPEYELTKLVVERGWTPHYLSKFRHERDYEILRGARVEIRKQIIRLRIRKKSFSLWLFSKMVRRIINLQLNLFGIYTLDISVGNPGHEEME